MYRLLCTFVDGGRAAAYPPRAQTNTIYTSSAAMSKCTKI